MNGNNCEAVGSEIKSFFEGSSKMANFLMRNFSVSSYVKEGKLISS